MRLAGIDGCKGGWVAVHAKLGDANSFGVASFDNIQGFFADFNVDFAVIDIPIGFSSGPDHRNVEAAMRKFLPGRTSCVFNTPCRQALAEVDREAASSVNRKVLTKVLKTGISTQSHGIFPKMRAIDKAVSVLGQSRLREGHPEVTFAVMNDDCPILSKKKSAAGKAERIVLLEKNGLPTTDLLAFQRRLGASRDDVLDAAAMLWSATRFQSKTHRTFPLSPERDLAGLLMSVIA